jgi:hypothetical protein
MHESVLAWVAERLTSDDVKGLDVLEVGSYDVNGSVRPIVMALEPASYVGVDQSAGPGVDVVCEAADLTERFAPRDLVISTEMLEHVVDWQSTIVQLVNVVARAGLLVLTTRSPGFPYHPYPIDTWRYTAEAMRHILDACGLDDCEVVPDPQAPGVFATARKPLDWVASWRPGLFEGITVEAMVAP